MPEFVNYDKEL